MTNRKLLATAICVGLSLVGSTYLHAHSAPSGWSKNQSVESQSRNNQSEDENSDNQNAAKKLQGVTVTGSLIKKSVIEGAQPVLWISREQIETSGATSVADLLQRMSVSGAALNRQSGYSTANGATRVDLRYLGAVRTLVLVDGHRLTPGSAGLGLQASMAQAPDLSVIPTSIVQSIQILLDGASATYGSDAIAGVVNIITRKNYNGAQATVSYGCYTDYNCDGKNRKFNLTLGHVWDRGALVASITYKKAGEVNSGDRAITRSIPGTGNLFLSTGLKGSYTLVTPDGLQNLTLNDIHGSTHPTPAGLHPATDADLNDKGTLYPPYLAPQEVGNVYLQGYFRFTDNVKFNSTFIYSKRDSYDVGGYAYAYAIAGSIPKASAPSLVIPRNHKFNPYPYDLVVNANGVSSIGDTLILMRPDTNKLTTYDYDATFMQYMGGLSGYFNAFDRPFDWEVSFSYGNETEHVNLGGAFSSINLRNALGSPAQCGPGTIHPNCVPYNLFGPNTQAASNYLFYTSPNSNSGSQTVWKATISSPEIANLPGGPLGFAFGYERRKVYGHTTVDPLREAGLSVFASTEPSSGSYSVNAVYGELSVPLLHKLPGAYRLALDLQTRHVDFSTFGGNTSSRIMLTYNPVKSLLLRATWAQGFRAPGLNDLFEGASQSFPPILDPCLATTFTTLSSAAQQRCLEAGVPTGGAVPIGVKPGFIAQGNPDLQPETSISRTFGLVWNPDFIPGLGVHADYYRINVDHAISKISPQSVLNACYLGGNEDFCQSIQRTPSTGIIYRVINSVRNISRIETAGIDYGVSYKFPKTSAGKFALALDGTHIRHFNETTPNFNGTGGVSTQRFVGFERGARAFPQGVPANKASLQFDWRKGQWSANYRLYYTEGITGSCSRVSTNGTTNLTELGLCSMPNKAHPNLSKDRMPDVVYNDVSAAYTFPAIHTTFRLGINNLLDRDPPICYSCSSNFDPTLYRVPGRFVYLRIEAKM